MHGLRGHPRETWEASIKVPNSDELPEAANKRRSFKSLFGSKHPSKGLDVGKDDRSSRDKVFWPADFLDHDLSNARIWTYGYNADLIGDMFEANNKNNVSQHGRNLSVQLERDIQNEVWNNFQQTARSLIDLNRIPLSS